MSREIEVHIDYRQQTHLVGRLYVSNLRGTESATFSYDPSWLIRPDAFALEPGLPLASGIYVSGGAGGTPLPASIRDGAPDRWGISLIQRAARKEANHPRTLGQLDYLLALDDYTRIGALRYKEKGQGQPFLNSTDSRTVPPLINIQALMQAADAVNRDTETAEDLRYLLGYGSPLGGARPKSAVMDTDGRLIIAKFPKPDDTRNLALGEVLALTLAKQAGIDSAEASLIRVEGRPVSLIRRFDRDEHDHRKHFISALTMLQAREGTEETYTAIAEQIRQNGSAPQKDLRELWTRIVFTVLVSNRDDHLRNHGFLYDQDGRWRLAPAYDINPVPIHEKGAYLETWINEAGPEATLERAMESHQDFMLSLDDAKSIVSRVSAVCETWHKVGRALGGREADLAPYETAFHHDQLGEAKKLTALSLKALIINPSPQVRGQTPMSSDEKLFKTLDIRWDRGRFADQPHPEPTNIERVTWRFLKSRPQFVWEAAQLEGNPFTFPEVQTLLDGVTVGGRALSDELQVLNLARSFQRLVEMVQDQSFKLDRATACELQGIISFEEALEWGVFRGEGDLDTSVKVGLGEHTYTPKPTERGGQNLIATFERGVDALKEHVSSPIERAFALKLFMAREQFFFDGNKRTSRAMMNGVLMGNGYDGVSIPVANKLEYNTKMVDLYLKGRADSMMLFFNDRLLEISGPTPSASMTLTTPPQP